MSIVSLSTTITSTADSGWLLDSECTGDKDMQIQG